MKKLSYNIRGVGGSHKQRELRELVKKEKLGMLCIQETTKEMVDDKLCKLVWGTRGSAE